jgi:hypothetical protein
MSYVNTRVDFFSPFGPGVLSGIVLSESDNERIFEVKIDGGSHHELVITISIEDLIEDSEFPEETFERFYKWYSED